MHTTLQFRHHLRPKPVHFVALPLKVIPTYMHVNAVSRNLSVQASLI